MVNRVEYRTGTFKDYAGNERKYVVAAVSELIDPESMVITNGQKENKIVITEVCKRLSLGFAICSPEDEWNEELGKTIAFGKAVKRPAREMYVTHRGMINTTVVNALIDQECAFFENCPGSIIAGYNEAEAKYNANKSK